VQAALAGLDGVDAVEHEAGTELFVVKHHGKLNAAVQAVDGVVILRWARRGLEKLGQQLQKDVRRRP
jgi:hypothetical protein